MHESWQNLWAVDTGRITGSDSGRGKGAAG